MNSLISASLFGWIPVSFVLFAVMGPRRGVVATYLFSSVFLPPLSIDLPGLPDFTRLSAAAIGSVLGTLAFGMHRLAAVRPRWFDLPAVGMTILPFVSSMTNDLGPYDGLSAALSSCLVWTIPYSMGRLHLGDSEAIKDLAVGLTITGLLCAPLILFEVATGKLLVNSLMGMGFPVGYKYGLANPALLVGTPLQLAIYMAVTGVAAYGLWITQSVDRVAGLPVKQCFWIVAGAALACHQTAAIGLMVLGLIMLKVLTSGPGRLLSTGAVLAIPLVLLKGGLRVTALYATVLFGGDFLRRSNPDRLVWLLILLIPAYTFLRATGLWGGDLAVSIAYLFLGLDRAVSIGYRFMCENLLVEKALQRPLFGWGGWGRSRVEGDYHGVSVVTDGLWVIVLGQYGLAGLSAMIGTLSLPLWRFVRSYPTRMWRDPAFTPAAALGIGLQLYSIDNLLNASISPIPILISGALMTLEMGRRARPAGEADPALSWADQLAEAGHDEEAEAAYARLASVDGPVAADAWGRLADLRRFRGRWVEAIEPAELAVTARTSLVRAHPGELEYRRALADDVERLARCLARSGEYAAALSLWEDVAATREYLANESRHDEGYREAWARSLNDLAWLLAEGQAAPAIDPSRAIALAEQAVVLDPEEPAYWNTLGLAYHRANRWEEAASSLGHSSTLGGDRGANDLLLSLVWRGRGDEERALRLLSEADAWLAAHPEASASLRHVRAEALGLGPAARA